MLLITLTGRWWRWNCRVIRVIRPRSTVLLHIHTRLPVYTHYTHQTQDRLEDEVAHKKRIRSLLVSTCHFKGRRSVYKTILSSPKRTLYGLGQSIFFTSEHRIFTEYSFILLHIIAVPFNNAYINSIEIITLV